MYIPDRRFRAHRWISFAMVFSFIYCWVLIFALSPCYILMLIFWEMMHWWVRGLSCKLNIYVSCPFLNNGWVWRRETGLSPPVEYFTDRSGAVLLLWIFYVFSVLCLLRICLRLFICALWSHAGKRMTSWLSFVVSNCEFVTFPLVSWDGCDTWWYRFLVFAPLLTLTQCRVKTKYQL